MFHYIYKKVKIFFNTLILPMYLFDCWIAPYQPILEVASYVHLMVNHLIYLKLPFAFQYLKEIQATQRESNILYYFNHAYLYYQWDKASEHHPVAMLAVHKLHSKHLFYEHIL